MPHVMLKLYSGKTEEQKKRLAEAVTNAITATLDCSEDAVSIAIEDVAPERWAEDVYRTDILGNAERLVKRPGYNPFR